MHAGSHAAAFLWHSVMEAIFVLFRMLISQTWSVTVYVVDCLAVVLFGNGKWLTCIIWLTVTDVLVCECVCQCYHAAVLC